MKTRAEIPDRRAYTGETPVPPLHFCLVMVRVAGGLCGAGLPSIPIARPRVPASPEASGGFRGRLSGLRVNRASPWFDCRSPHRAKVEVGVDLG